MVMRLGHPDPRVKFVFLILVVLTTLQFPAWAQPAVEPRFQLDFGVARFDGKYGSSQSTAIDQASARLRWFLPRGEIQVTAPFYRLTGPGEVRFVGGNPVPGFQNRFPPGAGPPGGRPGGLPGNIPGPGQGSGTANGDQELLFERSSVTGLGDVTVQGEAYLLEGTGTRPWITGILALKIPTADENQGLGTGKTDIEAGLGVVQPAGIINLIADASFIRIGRPDWIELRDVVRLGGGVSLPLGARPGTHLYAYLENRRNPVLNLGDQRSLALGTGLRLGHDGNLRLSGALSIGLSDTVEDLGLFLRVGRAF
jgi:hypothetical protein